jgi:hypothetical protein
VRGAGNFTTPEPSELGLSDKARAAMARTINPMRVMKPIFFIFSPYLDNICQLLCSDVFLQYLN